MTMAFLHNMWGIVFCVELVVEVKYNVGEVWREMFKHDM
jgi:hypothetical protein